MDIPYVSKKLGLHRRSRRSICLCRELLTCISITPCTVALPVSSSLNAQCFDRWMPIERGNKRIHVGKLAGIHHARRAKAGCACRSRGRHAADDRCCTASTPASGSNNMPHRPVATSASLAGVAAPTVLRWPFVLAVPVRARDAMPSMRAGASITRASRSTVTANPSQRLRRNGIGHWLARRQAHPVRHRRRQPPRQQYRAGSRK